VAGARRPELTERLLAIHLTLSFQHSEMSIDL